MTQPAHEDAAPAGHGGGVAQPAQTPAHDDAAPTSAVPAPHAAIPLPAVATPAPDAAMPDPLLRRLHHIGIVTADLDGAIGLYERVFGAQFSHRAYLADQGVHVALARLPDGGEIELLAPVAAESGVARFLATRGPGLHHVAYAVPDLPAALAHCHAAGLELIDPEPRPGACGLRVAFVHPRSAGGVLIELVEA